MSVKAKAISYKAYDLNIPGASSTAYGINDLFQITGVFSTAAESHPVLWNPDGSYTLLAGEGAGAAYGINNLGQVVGEMNRQPVIWNSIGDAANLPLPQPISSGAARSISDTGWIAGSCSSANSGLSCAVIWKPGSSVSVISGSSAFAETFSATGINDSGQAVGESTHGYAPPAAAYYSPNGGYSLVAGGIYGPPAIASGINNSGQMVGMQSSQAALWNLNGETVLLGYGFAYNINNAGQIVGKSGNYAAFWDIDGIKIDLPTLNGTISSEAYDINEFGWIVGKSVDTASVGHATLWEPLIVPEPSTLIYTIIYGIGGIGMSMRRRT